MDYTTLHAKVLKQVEDKGAPVSFTKEIPGEHDPETETFGEPRVLTVAGNAVEIVGDPEVYDAMKLTELHPTTLMFVPSVFGQIPDLDSVAVWAGEARTVRDVKPIRPAGDAIAARVVLV